MSERPDYRITAKHKETGQHVVREYTDRNGETRTTREGILVAWEGKYGPKWALAPGWELHGPHGIIITTGKEGTHYLNQDDMRQYKAESAAAAEVGDTGNDIPF